MFKYILRKTDGSFETSKTLSEDGQENEVFKLAIDTNWYGIHNYIPAKLDDEGNEIEPAKPKNYEIIKEDLTNSDENPKMIELRAKRDRLLKDSDFSVLPDAPLTEEQKTAYLTYRQQLRDLPENVEDLDNPVFPSKP